MDQPTDRSTWPIGLRVSRKDTHEAGTVIENNNKIKVKWDSGETSYYRHGREANIQLQPVKELGPP